MIVAGTRDLDRKQVDALLAARLPKHGPNVILSGRSGSVDLAGEAWAATHGVPVEIFNPDWKRLGRAAGPIRNEAMAMVATHLFLLWDGKSRGSADMLRRAVKRGLPFIEWRVSRGYDEDADVVAAT